MNSEANLILKFSDFKIALHDLLLYLRLFSFQFDQLFLHMFVVFSLENNLVLQIIEVLDNLWVN